MQASGCDASPESYEHADENAPAFLDRCALDASTPPTLSDEFDVRVSGIDSDESVGSCRLVREVDRGGMSVAFLPDGRSPKLR